MRTDVILLVDDNPDDVTLTLRALRKNDFHHEVVVARDGVEAVELLLPDGGGQPLRPVIVILDLNMPRMNGLELLRRLRSEDLTRSLPVIILTTSNEDRDVSQSYEAGANGFVRKPVTYDDFLVAAKALGTYWLQVNEPVPDAVG